jgi:hypothetical protein
MMTFLRPPGTVFNTPSCEHPLELSASFTLKVLGTDGNHSYAARGIKLMGRRLIAQISEYLKPGDCVRIDCYDAFLLGEISGCWQEESTIFAAIELEQALTGLAELARLGVVDPHRSVEVRQSA